MTLIPAAQPLAVLAGLATIVALATMIARTRIGSRLSPAPILVILSACATSLGLMPADSEVHKFIGSALAPVAVALLLLPANLRTILSTASPVLMAFALGVVFSLAGAALAMVLLPLGADGPALAGLYAAVVSGGMVNLISVGDAAGIFTRSPTLLAAIISGSVLVDVVYLAVVGWLGRHPMLSGAFAPLPVEHSTALNVAAPLEEADLLPPLPALAIALATALGIVAASTAIAGWISQPSLSIVIVGTIALLVANVFPLQIRRLGNQQPVAMLLLFLFLASITGGAAIGDLGRMALLVACFATIVYAVHLTLLLSVGRKMGLPLPTLLTGSIAGIGGPSITAAMSGAMGWTSLVLPGTLAATLGLGIGTYLGLAVYGLLR